MESIRFDQFTSLIDGIHKSINKLKLDKGTLLGIKSVHVSWLYHLSLHPDGLTSAEIAAESRVDRSLVSREIAALKKAGYITALGDRRFALTPSGKEIVARILEIIKSVQDEVGLGISEEELESFYKTLKKLDANFTRLVGKKRLTSKKHSHTSDKGD